MQSIMTTQMMMIRKVKVGANKRPKRSYNRKLVVGLTLTRGPNHGKGAVRANKKPKRSYCEPSFILEHFIFAIIKRHNHILYIQG